MSDFMDGDKFPNRPSHPDFWRLSEIVLKLDGGAKEGGITFRDSAKGLIDMDSLIYLATQRVDTFCSDLGMQMPTSVRTVLITVFVTSVITGIEFEKAGGHQ